MSGVEWLYFPLFLLVCELLIFKIIGFIIKFVEDNAVEDNKKDSKKKEIVEEKTEVKEKSKEVVTKDVEDKTSSSSASASEKASSNIYSKVPYVAKDVVYGNYLCDFFDYDSDYVMNKSQHEAKQVMVKESKMYTIQKEMLTGQLDHEHCGCIIHDKIKEMTEENVNKKKSILDEFNGLSKEMKLLLINSMLNK